MERDPQLFNQIKIVNFSLVQKRVMYTSKQHNTPDIYHGHVSPVNKIMWNPYYPLIFITCASKHVLYIWHRDLPSPILHFDLGSCVGDVAWAPYSSTVFAAVTSCGRVFVFDIVVSKYKAICKQVKGVFKKKLSKTIHNVTKHRN